MKILITGFCGFGGNRRALREPFASLQVFRVDNFNRPGIGLNRLALRRLDIGVSHSDVRNAIDFETIPDIYWIIDSASNRSVLGGSNGPSSPQVIENNFWSADTMLEHCRRESIPRRSLVMRRRICGLARDLRRGLAQRIAVPSMRMRRHFATREHAVSLHR